MPVRNGNAKAVTCKLGYGVYLVQRGRGNGHDTAVEVTLETLRTCGHDPLPALRTWNNWQEQHAEGVPYELYRSINRQDYFHTGVPVEYVDPQDG